MEARDSRAQTRALLRERSCSLTWEVSVSISAGPPVAHVVISVYLGP